MGWDCGWKSEGSLMGRGMDVGKWVEYGRGVVE